MDDVELSRRKALAALGTVGAASAGAGLGTSAYFSDEESFDNNQLTAGTLDMKVSWAEHYSDWSEDEADHAHMEDGELVVDDRQGFMDATLQEQFPDKRVRRLLDEGDVEPCDVLADVPDDLEKPVIDLSDVKPGDFGEVTFDFALCDNPGFLRMNGELLANAENGLTEPEADDADEAGNEDGIGAAQLPGTAGSGELADALRITVWDDADCDNVVGPDETVLLRSTSLVAATHLLSAGLPLSGDLPAEEGGGAAGAPNCYSPGSRHCIGFLWELPVDHGNEVQSDAVRFDLGFDTEQCRHNTGLVPTGGDGGLPDIPGMDVEVVSVDAAGIPPAEARKLDENGDGVIYRWTEEDGDGRAWTDNF
jgi:predicted ribosomally synthesized peptide with SipW-like signal peptide